MFQASEADHSFVVHMCSWDKYLFKLGAGKYVVVTGVKNSDVIVHHDVQLWTLPVRQFGINQQYYITNNTRLFLGKSQACSPNPSGTSKKLAVQPSEHPLRATVNYSVQTLFWISCRATGEQLHDNWFKTKSVRFSYLTAESRFLSISLYNSLR